MYPRRSHAVRTTELPGFGPENKASRGTRMDLARFPVDKADFDGPVLITGAGGCIGSWALALLVRAGVPVVAYDLTDDRRRPRLLMGEDELAQVPWVTGDIADTAAVAEVVAEHRGARDHPSRGAAGAVLQGRPGRRRQGQRGRHGQRARGGAPPRPQAGRLRQLDRGAQLLAGRALARYALWRLQAHATS